MAKEEMIVCTKCGEKMRLTQRNCLKCGQLNYNNPDNDYMKKYVPKDDSSNGGPNEQKTYVIGQGTMNKNGKLSIYNNLRPNEVLSDKAGNLTICALVNILFYLVGLVLFFLMTLFVSDGLVDALLNRVFAFYLIFYSLSFILVYSLELLFMKANKPWWGALVPIYNSYLLYEIVMSSGWFFIFSFIPVVGVIIGLCLSYNLGKVYGVNPWLTFFFGPIMWPFMAFSNTTSYNGIVYVNRTKKDDPSSALYKWNRRVLTLAFICIIGGISSIIYDNRVFIIYKCKQLYTRSFIKDAQNIVEDAKKSIRKDKYTCSNGIPLEEQEEYYIHFNNAGAYFNSSKVSDSALSAAFYQGYIRVVKRYDVTRYYISIDDTIYGIPETSSLELKNIYAEKNIFSVLPDDVVVCDKDD